MLKKSLFLIFLSLFFISNSEVLAQTCSCDSTVTAFTVNLSANPDTTWSISSTRNGHCCSASGNDRCIKFLVTTHPNTTQVGFDVTNPSPPGGAFYQVDCGTPTSLGTPLCVTNDTSFCITYCKSGNDNATYTISTSQGYATSSDISVREGCTDFMFINGMMDSTITWTSVAPGAQGDYDGYLSCTSGCDTTYVTPTAGAPSYVDYQVSGYLTGCSSSLFYDTVRVYISPGMSASVTPDTAYVCSGASNAVLTANATGGAPPYSYQWSTGDTTQSIAVGTGTYWVDVSDTTTGCPPIRDTAVVLSQPPVPIPTAGSNSPLCEGDTLNLTAGNVAGASYTWSGPNGFTSTQQNPSITNVTVANAGTYYVYATVNGCNSDSDSVAVTINTSPAPPSAGNNGPLCEGDQLNLTASSVAGATYNWTGPNGFTSTQQNPSIASVALADSGYYYVTVTVSGCTSNQDSTKVVIDPKPAAPTASSNSPVCVGQTINLSATTVAGASYSWSGPNGFSSTQQNPGISNVSTADSGLYTVTVTVAGCTSDPDSVVVDVDSSEVVNAGTDQTYCADVNSIPLSGSSSTGSGTWTTSGSGAFSPSANNLTTNYLPSSADTANGSVSLYLSSTNNGACGASTDTIVITFDPEPAAFAGADQTVCANNANVNLNGNVRNATGGTWITSGDGSFSPSAGILNPTYSPGPNDTTNGSVTLTLITTGNGICSADSSSMIVTITPAPVVNAGADQTACKASPDVTLNGSVTGPTTTGQWSTSGSGTFNPNNTDLNATYSPSSSDTAAGSVTIVLTSTNNGTCNPVTDTMVITYIDAAVANAGSNVTVCANNADVTLNGSSSTGYGYWVSSGSGTFSPNDSTLNATYSPSSADTAAGNVTLTLITKNNGTCTSDSSTMTITYTDAPVANAGPDQSVCINNPTISLNGSVTVATGGTWITSGDGSFSPSAGILNPSYTAGPNDTANGSVTLTLITTGNGNCLPDSNSMVLTFTPAPVVNAGADQTACKTSPDVTLNGSVTGPTTTGQWSTSGSGTFSPNNTDLNATYSPSSADTAAGSVTIVLTSTNNGTCNPVTDTMVITYIDMPVANAGNDVTVCANNADVSLNGTSSTGTGQWSTSGSGTFSPNNTDLNATYSPSSADTAAGSVTITLTTTNNGLCTADTSNMTITITDAPVADPGPDQTVCANNANVSLNGSVSVGTGGKWYTSGDGSFSPSDSVLNTTYIPGTNDTSAGSVTLTLVSTGNGNCLADTGTMTVTITSPPTVNAGGTIYTCLSNPTTTLNGFSSTGSGQWTTLGSGSFTPNNTTLNADYVPSSSDTANGSVQLVLTSTNNGNCLPVTDTLQIIFTPVQVVNAGNDTTLCANNAQLPLNGQVSNGSPTGYWSTTGGGVFLPGDSTLNATYYPDSTDTANGSVTLILTSTFGCQAVQDSLILTITPAPDVNAGPDLIMCKNNPNATLNGSVTGGASTGVWSTPDGTGTFSPDTTSLTTTYIPSSADTAAGSVTIVLTSTNNGNCLAESDTMIITYINQPSVNAGPDQTVCANTPVQLNGTVTQGSGTGAWSTPNGTGTFSPSNTALNAQYIFSASDTSNGSVTIVLTSTNNGNCIAVTDTMEVTITPAPTANAGSDVTVCANNDTVPLAGNVTNASGGMWSSTGDGMFFPADSLLNSNYIPGSNDSLNGSVQIILATTGNGICDTVRDTMNVTITPAPVVNAGPDQYICEGTTSASLNGSVSGGASTGQWSTSGTGSFTPSSTNLNATYNLSAADTAAGSVTIVLTSTNNGNCLAVSDSMQIIITTLPTVDAGSDTSICSSLDSLQLSGNVTGGSGTGKWTTSGSGSFSPADTLDSAYYVFSPQDTTGGSVTLYYSAINSCAPQTDSIVITLLPSIIANAGNTINICEGESALLNGNITNASNAYWISTGSGIFVPDSSALNGSYVPSSADIDSGYVDLILTITDSASCDAERTDTVRLNIGSKPIAGFYADPACANTTSDLIDSSTVDNGTLNSWIWIIGNDTLTAEDTTYAFGSSGTFTITHIVGTNNGCYDTLSKTVTVSPVPQASYEAEVQCGNTVVFKDQSGIASGSISTWNWQFGDGDSSDVQNPTHTYADTGAYVVTLTVESDSGCTSQYSDTVHITAGPEAIYEPEGGTYAEGEEIEFTDLSAGGISSWLWNFDDGNTATAQHPAHTYENPGSYRVLLTVTDAKGCTDTVSYEFVIESSGGYSPVAVPTAFTPNGDGQNDKLFVVGGPLKSMEFRVFNEWGNEIFFTDDQNTGWDGTIGGSPQPNGTFVYVLIGETYDGEEIKLAGEVNLIR